MTTKQMDYILELAKTLNFNRAAENLFISTAMTMTLHSPMLRHIAVCVLRTAFSTTTTMNLHITKVVVKSND